MNSVRGWKEAKIGDFLRIKHGYAFKGKHFTDSGEYIVLTPGNFREDGGIKYQGKKEKYYEVDPPEEFILKKGDFLVVMTDLTQQARILGSPAIIPISNRLLHNQRLGKIIDLSPELDVGFLYHLFNWSGVRNQLKGSATGSTVRHTAPDRIYQVGFRLPPHNTQKAISYILSAYDNLIENNIRRIQILEEMAQKIYTEWFVHFRFPGHKEVKMVDREMGRIPSGWQPLPSTDPIQFKPKIKVPKEGQKPFVSMAGLSETSMQITQTETRSGNSGAKFQNGDTLFARITPCLENGKTGYVNFLPTDDDVAIGSTEFIVMRSRTLCPEYVYCLARSIDFRENAIKSMAGASGRQRVRNECFDNFFIAHPDADTLRQFRQVVSPMFSVIETYTRKNAILRQTRDFLLPKLISGEIDVSDIPVSEEIAA